MSVQQVRMTEQTFMRSSGAEIITEIDIILRKHLKTTIRDLALRVQERCTKLSFEKVCARWVQHMVTADHKLQCLDCSVEFLQECASNIRNSFTLLLLYPANERKIVPIGHTTSHIVKKLMLL